MNLFVFLAEGSSPYPDFVEELKNFVSKLIPNFWSFLIQLTSLIILIFAVIFLAYKPIKKLLKQRADYVEGNINESEKNKKESIVLLDEAQKNVTSSKKEAQEIIEKAQKDAQLVGEGIISESKEKARKNIEDAQKQINSDIEKAQDDIRKQIVDVGFEVSKKVLEREVNEKDNDKLIDSFVDDLKKDK